MTDEKLHPEVEALMVGTPTCEHGNYTEADVRAIALLAASKAREQQKDGERWHLIDALFHLEITRLLRSHLGVAGGKTVTLCDEAIRRGKP